jgi:aspartate/methionine/tyrosine aminotransferase
MQINDFRLERYLAEYEFTAPRLLCTSDCETLSIGELLAKDPDAAEEFAQLSLGYTESAGNAGLRSEIAQLYQTAESGDILVCAGAEEAIFCTMHAMLNPGDHVIVQFPAYQSLYEVAHAIGCTVSRWGMNDSRGWRPDIEELKALITPKTQGIIINTPHNPTGYQFRQDEYAAIRDIAEDARIPVFSDEVYRFLEYSPRDSLPPMADMYDRGISVGVMSKAFGLAGLRIGWIATRDADLLRRITAFKDYTTICSSAPSEYLATLALRHRDTVIGRNMGIIQKNLRLLDAFFASHTGMFTWIRPCAGAIAFPRLHGPSGAAEFCRECVTSSGVLLLPSGLYDYGDRHVRFGFGRADMPDALCRLEEFLAQTGVQ